MRTYNPIILALDYANLNQAEDLLFKVRPHIGMVKIGLEMFAACGKDSLNLAKYFNVPVFLDLKLHDTPTTVKKTLEVLCGFLAPVPGQHFVSVHCFGGREMCKVALEVCRGSNVKPAGITILTSLNESDMGSFGFRQRRLGTKAVDLGQVGMSCIELGSPARAAHPGYPGYPGYPPTPAVPAKPPVGLDTLVCAPAQLELMRKHLGQEVTLITPGIRMEAMEPHDHKSAKPVSFALRNGANWIVVGRPITQHSDPLAMTQLFEKQAEKY